MGSLQLELMNPMISRVCGGNVSDMFIGLKQENEEFCRKKEVFVYLYPNLWV